MKVAALALLLLFLQTPQPATGTLEGVVVRADTGAPVSGALVQWTSSLDPLNGFNGPNPNPSATTGSDGKFTFKDLKPASYRVFVTANGFVRQEYGQRVPNSSGKPIFLSSGQTAKDLSISLTASATVSGRILTDAGQPATEILVQLVQVTYSSQGRTFRGVGMSNADDRGEFRIYGVTPGRYYLVAGNARVSQTIAPGAGDVMGIRMSRVNYGITFYPDVTDLAAASLLELKPGSDMRVDLVVKTRQPGYRVTGRVVDPENGPLPPPNNISLTSPFSPLNSISPIVTVRNTSTVPGMFEFLEVPPGAWLIRAEIRLPNPAPGPVDRATSEARTAAQALQPYGQTLFELRNKDVEDVLVTLQRGTTIPGRILVDGEAQSGVPNLDRISVGFQPSINGVAGQLVGPPLSVSRTADGTFQLSGVRDAEYQVRVLGLPPGFYVKALRYSGTDVSNTPLRFSNTSSGNFEVVVRRGAGQIAGVVTDAKSQPVPGAQAILIPEPSLRTRTELYKTATTDQNGRFTIPNIPPGNYKMFSWEALEQNGYYDPELLKQYEAQGQAIRIEESSNVSVDVRIIP